MEDVVIDYKEDMSWIESTHTTDHDFYLHSSSENDLPVNVDRSRIAISHRRRDLLMEPSRRSPVCCHGHDYYRL